jgi:hypothetical protein
MKSINVKENIDSMNYLKRKRKYMYVINIELFELKMKVISTRETKLLNYELDEIINKLEDIYCENTIYTKCDTDEVIENQMEYQIC